MKSAKQRRGQGEYSDGTLFRIKWPRGELRNREILRVLLVDDVITTGLTAAQVSASLLRVGQNSTQEVEVKILAMAQSFKADFTDSSSLSHTLESPSVQA